MSLLPPEVRAGYVYNRVLRAIGDRPEDEDRFPDGIPAKGTVTFTPKNSVKQVVSNNTGVTVTREPVVCTIHQGEDNPNLAGLLIDEAGAVGGVWLVVGEWTVSYQFEDRYSNVPNQDIVVTEDHTEENPLDVALVAGITPSPTIKFVVNEQIYVDTLAARDEVIANLHNMVISGEVVGDDLQLSRHGGDTIVAGNVRGPRGPIGPQGPMGTLELIGGDNPAITVDTSVGTRVYVGEIMVSGDTGWRDISSYLANVTLTQRAQMRRTGNIVTIDISVLTPTPDLSSGQQFVNTLPTGFRPNVRRDFSLQTSSTSSTYRSAFQFSTGGIGCWLPSVNDQYTIFLSYPTSDPWPTSLPGSPM